MINSTTSFIVIAHFELDLIPDSDLKKIYKQLILYYNTNNKFDYPEFEKILLNLDKNLVNEVSTLMLLADKDFLEFNQQDIKKEIIKIINYLNKNFINQKIQQIQKLLSQAEKENNQEQIKVLSKEFSTLTEQLNNIQDE